MLPLFGSPRRKLANASPVLVAAEVGLGPDVKPRVNVNVPAVWPASVKSSPIRRKSAPALIVWRPMNREKLVFALCEYHRIGTYVRSPNTASSRPYPAMLASGNFLRG